MKQYVILGAGVAGRKAAEAIRRQDAEGDIIMVEEQPDPFYFRPMLGEMLARGLSPEKIASKDRQRLSKINARLQTGMKVTSLNARGQEVVLSNSERIPFDKLLIASGRRTAQVPGDNGKVTGIGCMDSMADVQVIASALGSGKKAVLFGTGIQAPSAVGAMKARGIDCTLLLAEDRFWPGVLDPVASDIMEKQLQQQGISLIKEADIQGISEKDDCLTGILTTNGDEIPADILIVASQGIPCLEYLEDGELEIGQGIPVDDSMQIGLENIFAAGDVALPPLTGTSDRIFQPGWLNAWRQGNVAGTNMAGGYVRYKGIPSTRTRALDMDVVCLGLSDSDGPGIREESGDYPYEEMPYIYKKIVYKENKAAGALFLGDAGEAGHVEKWIRNGLKADQCDKTVLDQMFKPRIQAFVSIGALCPVCKFQIQIEDDFKEGSVVTCPACGIEFQLQRMPNGVFRAAHLT